MTGEAAGRLKPEVHRPVDGAMQGQVDSCRIGTVRDAGILFCLILIFAHYSSSLGKC